MPGFIIHLAVGKEMIRKKNLKIDEYNFYKGIIAPDLIGKKEDTHYGENSLNIDIKLYLSKNKINTDYDRGYFLHLITDYLFYNIYFKQETNEILKNKDNFYFDYDCINNEIVKKYNLTNIPEEAINHIHYIKGKPKYLSKEKVEKFIDDISEIDINNIEKIADICSQK